MVEIRITTFLKVSLDETLPLLIPYYIDLHPAPPDTTG